MPIKVDFVGSAVRTVQDPARGHGPHSGPSTGKRKSLELLWFVSFWGCLVVIRVVSCVASVCLLALAGCGPTNVPMPADRMGEVRLRDVADLYREYQASAKQPPKSLEDFRVLGDAAAPTAFSSIRSGQVVVRWEATLPDLDVEPTSPPSDLVLAYEKGVPEKGGLVLTLDRRIRTMTADEFKAARFAGVAPGTP
jgi:hypothetical protein